MEAPALDKIQNFDSKQSCQRATDAVLAALEAPLAELGLVVEYRGGKYDPAQGEFLPKLVLRVAGNEAQAWANSATLVGLKAEDFGAEVTIRTKGGDKVYRLVSIDLGRPKYNVGVEEVPSGKKVSFNDEAIRVALGRPRNRYAEENRASA
jgi:hypothetical protein